MAPFPAVLVTKEMFFVFQELANPSVKEKEGTVLFVAEKPDPWLVGICAPDAASTSSPFSELHWRNVKFVVPTFATRPFSTYATTCVGLGMDSEVLPLNEICAMISLRLKLVLTCT